MQDQNDKEIENKEEEIDEEFVPEDNETHPSSFGRSRNDEISKLKEKLKKTEAEKQEYLDGWQRLKADVINLRKRDEEDKRAAVERANEDLIHELLPVLDSFEMAMANREAWEKADKNWRQGVEYIHSQLKSVLGNYGLSEIHPLGQKLDPSRDTPIEMVPAENESDDHMIVAVIQKGYSLNGKEIRSPKVKVAEFKKE